MAAKKTEKKADKKPTKRELAKQFDAWRECGKTSGEAALLVEAGKTAPSLEDRRRASQSTG